MPSKSNSRRTGSKSLATLLREWSQKVRERDGHRCQVCDSTRYVQAHHLLPKERYPEFKLEVENGLSLCVKHHKFGKFSAHRNPWWFVMWFSGKFPNMYKWVMDRVGDE